MLQFLPLSCLIVDDNASFLEASRAMLDGKALNVIGHACTADDALRRAVELRPDLVLLDIDLGDDSGIEVAKALESDHGDAAPMVIFISAHPEEDFADLVAETAALGFIAKSELCGPAIDELLKRVGLALENRA